MEAAIDCHVHVLDPARFPYAADVAYRPSGGEIAPVELLDAVLDAHGVRHALVVGPNSGYGTDNRCLLAALAHGAGRYRGIAVVPLDAHPDTLAELQLAGVVGVALNASLFGVDAFQGAAPLLQRLRELGMWAQVQVMGDQLAALAPMLRASGVRVLVDHTGRPDPAAGLGQPGFRALLALADTGRAAVKLSGLAKFSHQPHPHADAWPFVAALVDTFSADALVWASDWPFLRAPARTDYGPLRALAERLLPDPRVRRAVLWETPKRLFGF